ncbi:putative protein isoform X2 [Capsicum chacoense]
MTWFTVLNVESFWIEKVLLQLCFEEVWLHSMFSIRGLGHMVKLTHFKGELHVTTEDKDLEQQDEDSTTNKVEIPSETISLPPQVLLHLNYLLGCELGLKCNLTWHQFRTSMRICEILPV